MMMTMMSLLTLPHCHYHPASITGPFAASAAMEEVNSDLDQQAIYSFWPVRDSLTFKVSLIHLPSTPIPLLAHRTCYM